MTLKITLVAFIVSSGLYGAIAYLKSREIKSIKQFFHIESVRDGALSIVAGNLTLGTGLFYIASLAQQQALIALVVPIGVLIGYQILGRTVSNLSIHVEGSSHNILDSIRDKSGGTIFCKYISVIILMTFMVIIPFEIYISSSLFASILPDAQKEDMAIVFAVVLYTVVLAYSAAGGLRGIVATDIIQLLFIAIMIIIILGGSFYINAEQIDKAPIGLFPVGAWPSVITLAASSFVTAVTTQLYNIVNLTVGTSFNSENQIKLYKLAGFILFIAFIFFVLTGLATRGFGESHLAGIDLLLTKLSANGQSASAIIFFVIFGMVAVLVSTVDSGIMAISQLAYDNVFNFNSYSDEGGFRLLIVRIVFVVTLNAISAIPLILIFKHKPNLVALLLTSISALTVATPFMVSSALNIARFKYCLIFDRRISLLVIIFISLIWIFGIWRTFKNDNITGNYLILAGVFFGMIYFKIDRWISNNFNKKITEAQQSSLSPAVDSTTQVTSVGMATK